MSRGPFCRPPGAARAAESGLVEPGLDRAQAQAAATRCLATLECRWCEVCELMCPDLCITRDPDSGHIQIDLDHCKGCGLCAHFCPKGAIRMESEPSS